MAVPTITKQVLENGSRNYVAGFYWAWDGSHLDNLANYAALDPTSGGDMGVAIGGNTLYPGTHIRLLKIEYDLSVGIALELIWDASSPTPAAYLNGEGAGYKKERDFGGLYPGTNGAIYAGATGKVLFTTLGTPAAGLSGTVILRARKDISQ